MSGCQAALTKYFRKRLFVVTGIMYSASAIGMMTVGILTEYLIMYYGWRGSMMIQAGLSLQIIVFGTFVFRLPTTPSSVTNGNALSLPTTSKKARTPAKVYMKDVRFWCMSLCTTTLFMFTAIILVFWKDMMLNKDHFKAAMAGMAAGSTLGRATAGLISKKISPPIHNFILGLAGSGVVFIFLIADKLWIVVVHNFLWGFLNGQQFVADRLQLAWVYGGQEMPIVLGYTLLIVGFGSFCVPPLAGKE